MKLRKSASLALAAAIMMAAPAFAMGNRVVFEFETDDCGFSSIQRICC